MYNNQHMNIFHHYSQAGSLPIENNISRGLAILLQEYPAILLLLIEVIRRKDGGIPVEFPDGEYAVEFQKRTDSFGDAEQVIGVALTAAELPEQYQSGTAPVDGTYIPVTDISILYDNTLIIVEVKRDDTDCRRQLEEQIDRYMKETEKNLGMHAGKISKYMVSLSWKDITGLLETYRQLYGGKEERLVSDYYEELVYHFPEWFHAVLLNRLTRDDTLRINQRLDRIKEEFAKEQSCGGLIYSRGAVPINFQWASECNLHFDGQFLLPDGKRGACIYIGIWAADTCSQYWKLPGLDFIRKRYQDLDIPGYGILHVRIWPYLKLCHFNRGVMWAYLDEGCLDNAHKKIKKFSDEITGKWERENWGDFCRKVSESGIYSVKKIEEFKKDFSRLFEHSERSYLTASVGTEVFAYLTFEEAQNVEAGKIKNITMAELIGRTLKEMKKLVEGKTV